ncbi:MAG: hypothetical protein CVV64_09950 [Candidatus Wallbacteria bacterium HGW-Wallbacteria-1]|jgi:signal transduction histidine kinase|uniref:histidine kinase n=1 Tax=Candidatus Wallbacteria bacterium HGW-Wallbacteria-1 TaxID=2013854 RepID=A0A2N1PPL9_9BACT|nr:MAG: hypothetical protein CVV64_09950 [Candidatus Wallbacteria bacterium HGW-Wallbacteria-1]
MKSRKLALAFRVVAPAGITVILFVSALFQMAVPKLKSTIIDSRKNLLCEQVRTVISMLQGLQDDVAGGRISLSQARTEALKTIRRLRYGDNGKAYFWINDMAGNLLAHPYRNDLEGTNVLNFMDPQGTRLFELFIAKVRKDGQGYQNYLWQWQDSGGLPISKLSFVKGFKPWGWIVGTGLYIRDMEEEILDISRRLTLASCAILGVMILLAAMVIYEGFANEGRRVDMEKALEESESLFRAIFDQAFQMTEVLDTSGKILMMNQSAISAGLADDNSVSELSNGQINSRGLDDRPIWELSWWSKCPDAVEMLERGFRKTLDGETVRFEVRRLSSDGNYMIIDLSMKPVLDNHGRVVHIISEGRDVSLRRMAEQEAESLRAMLSNIINSMPSVIIGVDRRGLVNLWNHEATEITGIEAREAVALPVGRAFPAIAGLEDMVSTAISGRRVLKDSRLPTTLGFRHTFVDLTIYPLNAQFARGAVVRIDDVGERVKMEEIIVQSEKMVSLGGLAAGMAHEINNPLAGMLQNVQVMRNRLTQDTARNRTAAEKSGITMEGLNLYLNSRDILGMMDLIVDSGSRAATIIQQMLRFGRKSDGVWQPLSIVQVVEDAIRLAMNDYDLKKRYDFRNIEIVRDYEVNLQDVICEETQIQQVILNLLKNGAQAMAESGFSGSKPEFVISIRSEGREAIIKVADNGPGMDEQIRKRIFEPFFTTKQPGEGTGLGLSVSYFIICESHCGSMFVDSTPGKGTVFTIHLPMDGKCRVRHEVQ